MANTAASEKSPSAKRRRFCPWTLAFAGVLIAGAATAVVPPVQEQVALLLDKAGSMKMRKPVAVVAFASPVKLRQHFETMGYDLDSVRQGRMEVPRIFLSKVPDGLAEVKQTRERKAVFLRLMLPLILDANERVLQQRARLLVIDAKLAAGRPLTPEQRRALETIAAQYKTDPERIDLLLRKVDAVPPSLALAQAAIESGWGTSRFIRQGNAVFGQWTTAQHEGIVPLQRDEGKTHKIRSFSHLGDSVRSYIYNLNTHGSYRMLRDLRWSMRSEGKRLAGMALVPSMLDYSEKKEKYLDLLRSVIRVNKLAPLDGARLSNAAPA